MKRFFNKVMKETWHIDYDFVIPLGILGLLIKGFIDYFTKGYLIWHYYEWTFINEILGGTAFFLILSIITESYHRFKSVK